MFEIGDKVVMVIPPPYYNEFFPAKGVVGTVVYAGDTGSWVQWPEGSIVRQSEDDDLIRYCDNKRITDL